MKNIISRGTHKNMYQIYEYPSGKLVTKKIFKTYKEAFEWDCQRQNKMRNDGEIFNNLTHYIEMNKIDLQKVIEEQEKDIEELREELEDKDDLIAELEDKVKKFEDNFKD